MGITGVLIGITGVLMRITGVLMGKKKYFELLVKNELVTVC